MIEREKEISNIKHNFAMGRYEEAVPAIERLFENDPVDADAFYYMAVVYYSRDDWEPARDMCEQALYFGFDEALCYHFIGKTHEEEKNYREAEKAYLSTLQIEPENGETMASYGYLMLLTGHEEKALKLLEEAKNLEPNSERVNQYILKYYFAKSDKDQQLAYIKNVMDTASSEIRNLVNLGLFHLLKNDYHNAREYFRQAFLLDPTNKNLLEILEQLDKWTHPLFLPQRIIEKAGGAAIVYLAFVILIIIGIFLKQYIVFLLPFMVLYFFLCIYTWIDSLLYKLFVKGKF